MTAGLRYGVEIRTAVPGDAAEMARLLAGAGLEVPVRELAGRIEAMRLHPTAAVLVATGYGGLSGLVALHWAPALHRARMAAELTALVVDPEERRHGIGRLLLKAASQTARATGCDAVTLPVLPGQAAGEAFCRATGFAPQGTLFVRELRKRA